MNQVRNESPAMYNYTSGDLVMRVFLDGLSPSSVQGKAKV
jgi:hypothetical protein